MGEEEQNLNDIERRLQAYFRDEDQELDYPSGLWEQLAPRLGEQRRRGWVQRVPAISWRQAIAASMALILLIGVAYLGSVILEEPPPRAKDNAVARSFAKDNAVAFEQAIAGEQPSSGMLPETAPDTPDQSAPEPPTGDSGAGETGLVAMGQEIFTGAGGCSVCHTVEGVTAGLVGPDLTHIGTDASGRIAGVSAEDYLTESIRNPEAFVSEEVARAIPGLMTSALTANLSDQQVEALVQFLLAQK